MPHDHRNQGDFEQNGENGEQQPRKHRRHRLSAAFDRQRQPAGLPLQVKTQAQRVQLSEDA